MDLQRTRQTLGYIVEVDGSAIVVNLEDSVRSHVAGSLEGISSFEQPGDLVAVEAGSSTLVARVLTLSFVEPKELYQQRQVVKNSRLPLRQLKGMVIGLLEKRDGNLVFFPQTTRLPALGAQCIPLSGPELRAVLSDATLNGKAHLVVGLEARNPTIQVSASLDHILARHLAVLGATGQGKTHFVADLVQQVVDQKPKARVIIFDVNGEYYPAFKYLGTKVKYTALGDRLGRNAPAGGKTFKIPYFALGRHGLFRLLLPSEKTQAPALRFATEHLAYVEASGDGAKEPGAAQFLLFDDCRPGDARLAYEALLRIRKKTTRATRWPHMKAISCLVAESYAIESTRNGYARNSFNYGHIQSLISRLNSLIGDTHFNTIVDVTGGPAASANMDLRQESQKVVEEIFGADAFHEADVNIHVIDLSQLAQDLMPLVLGPLLELFAEQLFRRGPGVTHPTLLVLEEAHHYLRQLPGDTDTGQHALAYERLAKEGRKFGLSLLVSTQRPSELSPTVLAQCGTWATFRLTNELDKRAIAAAAEGSGLNVTSQVSGLSRGELLVFGAAFQLPIRLTRPQLPVDRRPDSLDPEFDEKWS